MSEKKKKKKKEEKSVSQNKRSNKSNKINKSCNNIAKGRTRLEKLNEREANPEW